MKWVASVVNRSFRRVERAADRVIGRAGPLFIAIYVGLVGAGVWTFFACVFPSLVTIPTALVQVWYLRSPVHIILGLPMAFCDSVMQQPYAMVQCVLVTLGCLYIASMMAWSYYMACMEPPGSVSEGMTEKLNERRYGPGSGVWWQHKCRQVSNAMLESASDAEDTSLYDVTIPYAHKNVRHRSSSQSGLEAKGHQCVNQPAQPRFRYCKKCPQVTMTEAILRLPPELRQVEKRNRRDHLLRLKQQEAHQTDVAHLNSNLAPELFVEVDDESETDVRAWLGEDRNNFVFAPKPERAHHCKTCKMCVLKFDHHCPWINQCVGLGNERYFILFMLWFALGTGIFGITGYHLAYEALWEYRWPYTHTPRVIFIMLYTIAVVMGFAVFVLAVWHLYLVASGETSVESQDNAHYRSMAKERKEQFINVYDLGWVRNLQIFFNTGRGLDYGFYTLLLPQRIEPYSDGWHFAKNPRLSGSHSGISREEEFTDDDGDDLSALN